jgi:hypothetical protein
LAQSLPQDKSREVIWGFINARIIAFAPLEYKLPKFSSKAAFATSTPILLLNDAAILGGEIESLAKLLSSKVHVGAMGGTFGNGIVFTSRCRRG